LRRVMANGAVMVAHRGGFAFTRRKPDARPVSIAFTEAGGGLARVVKCHLDRLT
jgi:hypothetical protein